MGRCHRSCSTPQSLPPSANFYSTVGRIKKKLRNRGGFQAAFPLYQMNRRKQKTRQKNQTESKPQKRNERKLSNEKDEKSMCSVTRSVVRFPACLSVRRRGQQQQQQRALEPNRRRNYRPERRQSRRQHFSRHVSLVCGKRPRPREPIDWTDVFPS